MTNWHKAIAHKIVSLVLVVACALPVAAQTTPPPQTKPPERELPPPSRPLPTRSVGLTPGKVVRWTLRDAILAALERNVDIEIERENVRLSQFDVQATRAPYDPITSSTISYNSSLQPLTNPFQGAQLNQAFSSSRTATYNFGWQQAIEKTGGSYRLDFFNTRRVSNISNFSTQYDPNLVVNFSQPLFRNFRVDSNRRQTKIAKKSLDLSDAVFRQRVIDIIAQVQQAYWDLAFALEDEKIQREAVALAQTSLKNNERQVEVGTLAPLDIVSASTQVESRRQSYFQALNTISLMENSLKSFVVSGPSDELWGAQIIPVDSFEIQPVALSLDDAIKLAFDNRPELKQFAIRKEQHSIDVAFFRDQTKPQIDFTASFGLIGLGGDPVDPTRVLDRFVGGYGTALGNLFGFDSRTWRVGVTFSLPLRNTQAKVNLGRELERGRQLDLQERRQLQSIELEVRNAIQSLETIKLRIETARANRIYAEQQLEGEQKKFEASLSTTFFILQRQNELTVARGSEQRALVDYNKAVAQLQRVISTTLSSNNIEIKSEIPATITNGKK
jgi:HAE1 family hydrophobic/amphiphilic exporter-1